MAVLILILASLWLALPFVPAFLELWRKTDADPLAIADAYAEDIRHTPDRFASYIKAALTAMKHASSANRDIYTHEGRPPLHLIADGQALPTPGQIPSGTPYVLHAAEAKTLPPNMVFEEAVFATHTIQGGPQSVFKSLYGRQDIHLGQESVVSGWVHGQGMVTVGSHSRLRGSASADLLLRVGPGCTFERLHAADVEFGEPQVYAVNPHYAAASVYDEAYNLPPAPVPFQPPGGYDPQERRSLVHGDLHLPQNRHFEGDLIVHGNLHIGAGTRIEGSVKAHGNVVVEQGVHIEGGLFTHQDLHIRRQCHLKGIVSAEGNLVIETDTRIGTPEDPTTLSGRMVLVAPGVHVHGTVWALEAGHVGLASAPVSAAAA